MEGLVSTINSEVEAETTKLKALKDIEKLYPVLLRSMSMRKVIYMT